MCSISIYVNLFLFFTSFACQTVGSILNLTAALGSNFKNFIPPELTVIHSSNSTRTARVKRGTPGYDQPPKIIIGNSIPGSIEICLFDNPRSCNSLTEEGSVPINAIAIAAEHIYAGLESGAMWRCLMQKTNSCVEISRANSAIKSIAVAYEFIYAGLEEGILRRCRVDEEDSCVEFKIESDSVNAIAVKDYDYVYAGWGSKMMKCAQRHHRLSCSRYYDAKVPITALTTFADEFIFVGLQSGALLRCPLNNNMDACLHIDRVNSGIYSLYVYNGNLYAGLGSGAMLRCPVNEKGNCEQTFTKKQGKFSFAITYSTVSLFQRVRGEHERCSWQKVRFLCPPYVIYYNYKQRAAFELNVKRGKIYHSSGEIFDTTEADPTHAGNRAIFVMDPGGRIYASNRCPILLVHHSSLLSGQPVSAAGEMEVIRGVIKGINNYSGHYRAPPDVNNQILDSLSIKGYKKPIEVRACDELTLNTSLYFQTLMQPDVWEMPVFCNDIVMNTSANIWTEA